MRQLIKKEQEVTGKVATAPKMEVKVVGVRKYKIGYEVRTESVHGVLMKSAYNEKGEYIGDPKWAHRLYKMGIKPEKADPEHGVCSIGFCEREQKWYGWSHRAIFSFGIGYVAQEGDCVTRSGWTDECLKRHPDWDKSVPVGFEAKTLEDCKRLAIAFADSVS